MFDAKSILESLVRGAGQQQPSPRGQAGTGGGGLADILGQILQGGGAQQGGAGGRAGGGGGGGFSDILAEVQRQLQGAQGGGQSRGQGRGERNDGTDYSDVPPMPRDRPGMRRDTPHESEATSGDTGAPGGLGDILAQLKDKLGQAGGAGAGGAGGIADVLGQILGQATSGAREGASRIGQATGANEALGRATGGQSTDELLEKLKGLVRDNPVAATGAAGGVGGLVLGTRTGRAIAGSAARIGALALIGGLAYKAFQNYQAGRPLIDGVDQAEAAPQGSGFEPSAVTNESATVYIRAMIAAAASDGRIDDAEQAKIIGGLKQAGVDAEAEEFLANELNNPASVDDLAGAVTSPEEAVQVYTAARIAIEPDARGEVQFLAKLAAALGIDNKLAAHIDATTRSASA